MNFDKYGGRRFLLSVAACATSTVLQWFGKLDPAGTAWGLVMAACVAAYITGNVAQRKNEEAAK